MEEVLRYLDEQGIPYFCYEHEPVFTMRECVEVEGGEDGLHCKNLFLCNRQRTDFFLLCIPGRKRYRTAEVSRQIYSSRLSFASDEDLLRLLGLKPGAVSPFGLLHDEERVTKLALDEDLLLAERISFHPNTNEATVVLTQADFHRYLDSISIEPVYFHLSE